MQNVPSLEAVYHDYAPKGVQFYYIYKGFAHAGTDSLIDPFTLEERLMQVRDAKKRLGSKIPWLIDGMENRVKHAFGGRNNSEFVIDPNGTFLHTRAWSDYEKLRDELAALVGLVDPPTKADDLDIKRVHVPRDLTGIGLVKPTALPKGSRPLKVKPGQSEVPYYAKLRAEASPKLLKSGTGKLHLGFYLDPLYHVHWNNLAPPIRVAIKGLGKEQQREGPQVDVESDRDGREFLIDVKEANLTEAFEISVAYYVCHDVDEWCKVVEQRYVVRFQPDPDAGLMRRRTVDGKWKG